MVIPLGEPGGGGENPMNVRVFFTVLPSRVFEIFLKSLFPYKRFITRKGFLKNGA
jgi:hypothetical protein